MKIKKMYIEQITIHFSTKRAPMVDELEKILAGDRNVS